MRRSIIACLLGLGATAVASGPAEATGRSFTAQLSRNVEIVDTAARGVATFQLSKDGKQLGYKLTVEDLKTVNQAHIHLTKESLYEQGLRFRQFERAGPASDHGPTVVFLLDFVPGGVPGQGTIAEGVITQDDLVGPLKGRPLKMLIVFMEQGHAYVNVHTVRHFGTGRVLCCPTGVRGIIRAKAAQ